MPTVCPALTDAVGNLSLNSNSNDQITVGSGGGASSGQTSEANANDPGPVNQITVTDPGDDNCPPHASVESDTGKYICIPT